MLQPRISRRCVAAAKFSFHCETVQSPICHFLLKFYQQFCEYFIGNFYFKTILARVFLVFIQVISAGFILTVQLCGTI